MEPNYMGKMVEVRIISASKFSLMSEPLASPKRPDVPEALEKGQISGLAASNTSSDPGAVSSSSLSRSLWPVLGISAVVGLRLAWIIYWRGRR
jgi:hypothetical protein